MRYGMLIDLNRCVGCANCAVSCKNANNLSEGVWWHRVITEGGAHPDTPAGTYPALAMRFVPQGCQHCGNAPCVAMCPTGATFKRDDGIVALDTEKCIGCQACMGACPYGARTFCEGEPTPYFDFALGDADALVHLPDTVEKCTFCANRLERGSEPACMELCPTRARLWGDLDDPGSAISQRIAEGAAWRHLEELGTDPSVYYIG